MELVNIGQRVYSKIKEIMERYKKYGTYLCFPYEWGERALRGWLVYEIFHEILEWPIRFIVMGEQFDVLFIDEEVRPRIYLETKKPGRGLAYINDLEKRTRFYGTLKYAVITDGNVWGRFEVRGGRLTKQMTLDIERNPQMELWGEFFKPLHARNFLYEVM